MRSRIMYIESKAGGLGGPARIGRVTIQPDRAHTLLHMGPILGKAGFNRIYERDTNVTPGCTLPLTGHFKLGIPELRFERRGKHSAFKQTTCRIASSWKRRN